MKKSELRQLIREELRRMKLNESGSIKTGQLIKGDVSDFLKTTVIPKSNGYVKTERDAALLLYDVLQYIYKIK